MDASSKPRCVSILVGDLRGCTFEASHPSRREVFARLCHFADQLTSAVQQRGGEICELHDHGVVAVFGGRTRLPEMERSAVEAARAICDAARSLPRAGPSAGATGVSMGVAVATGEATVGGVRAGGRIYWSAVGCASDRALRLHELARRHGAALAVDSRTYQAARLAERDPARAAWIAEPGGSGSPDAYWLPWSGS